jgi:suppressor of fused
MAKRKPTKKPTKPVEEPEDDAPGWHAIDDACEQLYPDQKDPLHCASAPHPPMGEGLIYGISAYKAEKPKHWHFVTYGFSELYAKETDDPDVSGWGFELTFRLARGKEKEPPAWAINFLMNLGKYVRRSGNPFGAGHFMDLNGPICLGSATAIRAIGFTLDPLLGTIDTPNGRVEFLQVVGLALDEHDACSDWKARPVFDLLRESNPLLVTDLDRRSALEDPAVAARVEAGIDSEGSSAPGTYVSVVEWKTNSSGKAQTATLTLGARGVQSLLPKLRSRLAHGRDFMLMGREFAVEFRAAKKSGWKTGKNNLLTIDLTPTTLATVRETLKPIRGKYTWPDLPGLTLVVQPSEITDSTGKVVEVVG